MLKIKVLLLSCFVLFFVLLNAQTNRAPLFTYEDASLLKTLKEANQKDSLDLAEIDNVAKFYSIFKAYGQYEKIDDDILLKENPFLKKEDLIKTGPIKKRLHLAPNVVFEKANLSGLVVTSLGIPTVSAAVQTKVLEGTSRFLAKRFREELSAYYLNTLSSKIEGQPIIKTLFPKTCDFLKVFANQVYNTDVAMLQASAEADMSDFASNFGTVLQYIPKIKDDRDLQGIIKLGLDIYSEQKEGMEAVEIINLLPSKNYLSKQYVSYLEVLRILSNSLRNSEPGNDEGPWAGVEDFEFFNLNDSKVRYYYALLYEQLKNVEINNKPLRTVFEKNLSKWRDWFNSFQQYYQNLKALNSYITIQKKQIRTKEMDFWGILNRSVTVVNQIYFVVEKLPDSLVKIPAGIINAYNAIQPIYSIVNSIASKKYSTVIPALIMIIRQLDENTTTQSLVNGLRYAAVLAQFAQVQNAEEMKELLESAALPVGSSSVKRKSLWNVSLNSYVGIASGWETAKGRNTDQTKASLGLSAPIGISISKKFVGVNTAKSEKGPFIPCGTVFLSFFDLGNLVNVRLNSDTTSIGEVKFSHFLSLGLGYYINFRNSPFTAGLSCSYVPSYRDFKKDNLLVENADVIRFRASIFIDIPITTFYNKPLK